MVCVRSEASFDRIVESRTGLDPAEDSNIRHFVGLYVIEFLYTPGWIQFPLFG